MPVLPGRGPDGFGRARSWQWPTSVRELSPDQLRHEPFDVVILQRPHERDLLWEWTGRRAGEDVATIYLEHNVPGGRVPFDRHPMSDQSLIPIVHVTPFNALMWDSGSAPTHVIEHGVIDPGDRYTGEVNRAAVVVNEPVRRGRAVGTDLILRLAEAAPVDVFGMGAHALRTEPPRARGLRTVEGLDQERLHTQMARRRVYLHPNRWTSLGLSLIEAMLLGMPVVAVASTEVPLAVPPEAGVVASRPDQLADGMRMFFADAAAARAAGAFARAHALRRFGLQRFLDEWDVVLRAAVAEQATRPHTPLMSGS
ncbi:glycosyltransferase [Humibacillus xanthopallidus]|uniref:glycosyltransferase n=1 Tax=Humibacillus xanthopallidus TaxID=412689 RepID=UPI002892DE6A|nr:glycosyltransferase [Humibacillus xanthopallidus]